MYHAAMEGAGFDVTTPLYVASGLLTYLNQSGVRCGALWLPTCQPWPRPCSLSPAPEPNL